jgi:hypothetical protein
MNFFSRAKEYLRAIDYANGYLFDTAGETHGFCDPITRPHVLAIVDSVRRSLQSPVVGCGHLHELRISDRMSEESFAKLQASRRIGDRVFRHRYDELVRAVLCPAAKRAAHPGCAHVHRDALLPAPFATHIRTLSHYHVLDTEWKEWQIQMSNEIMYVDEVAADNRFTRDPDIQEVAHMGESRNTSSLNRARTMLINITERVLKEGGHTEV